MLLGRAVPRGVQAAALPQGTPCSSPLWGSLDQTPTRRVLTYTAGLVARPLVVLLTRDDSLPHQLKGRLALERECVSVEKAAASSLTVGWDAWIPAPPFLNF